MMSRTPDSEHRAQGAAHGVTDAEIDRAIDVVARQMTEGSPAGGADFRRRVLARIEAGHAPRASWRAAWALSPLAVAAAIVVAIFVARGFRLHDVSADRRSQAESVQPRDLARSSAPQPEAVAPVTVRPKPPLDAAQGGPEPIEGPGTTVRGGTVRAVVNRAATNRATSPGLQLGAEAIAALAAPSLDLVPLTVDAITPDLVQIDRLDTTSPITFLPITVAPIDITDVQRRYE